MNTLDAILAVPLLWWAYRGFTKGFLVSIAALAGLVLGILAGIRFSDRAAGLLSEQITDGGAWIPLLAFCLVFIAVLIAVHFLARAVEGMVKLAGMGWANRLGGALFGVAKAAFLVSLVLAVLNMMSGMVSLIPEETKDGSLLHGPVASFAPAVLPHFQHSITSDLIHGMQVAERR